MKTLDIIVISVFVIALIILCFFSQCALDIYFIVFGFAAAAMCGYTLYKFNHKSKEKGKQEQ